MDYGVPLTILEYGDCTSYKGQIIERMLDYRGVGLVRFHCMYIPLPNAKFISSLRNNVSLIDKVHSQFLSMLHTVLS